MAISLQQLMDANAKRTMLDDEPADAEASSYVHRPWEDPPAEMLARINATARGKDLKKCSVPDSGTTRVQKAPDSGTTRVQKAPDSGTTRVQKAPDSGTTRVQKAPDSGTTRVQKAPDSGTTRVQKAPDSGTTRVQKAPDSGTTRVQKAPDSGTTRVQKAPDSGTTRIQKAPDSGTTRVQKAPDSGTTRVQKAPDSGTTRVQKAPDSGTTRVQKILPELRQSSKRDLLIYLLQKAGGRAGKTPFLSRRKIASELSISTNTVKVSLQRLVQDGFLQVDAWAHSCKNGGACYVVTKVVEKQIWYQSTRVQSAKDLGTNDPVVVVVSKDPLETRTTTDSEHILAKTFSQLETRLNLSGRFKIGARDLADAFRKCELPIEKFEMSVEHAAFHAASEAGATLRNPSSWIIKRIGTGYEHEPANFESWAERQERVMLEDAQKRLQRLRSLQKQRFDVDFEEHMLKLSTTNKQQLLCASEEGQFFAETPNSAIATGQLKRLFAKETARLYLLEGDRDDNLDSSE